MVGIVNDLYLSFLYMYQGNIKYMSIHLLYYFICTIWYHIYTNIVYGWKTHIFIFILMFAFSFLRVLTTTKIVECTLKQLLAYTTCRLQTFWDVFFIAKQF